MKTAVIPCCLLLMVLGACSRERPSQIVKLAEESGAGPLTGVSTAAMRHWLKSHPQVAIRVNALCAPLQHSATAAWPETTEGRLCMAARSVAGQIEAERQLHEHPDHTGFLPGWR